MNLPCLFLVFAYTLSPFLFFVHKFWLRPRIKKNLFIWIWAIFSSHSYFSVRPPNCSVINVMKASRKDPIALLLRFLLRLIYSSVFSPILTFYSTEKSRNWVLVSKLCSMTSLITLLIFPFANLRLSLQYRKMLTSSFSTGTSE